MHRLISAGFAIAALASASVPALAWTQWPEVDLEWYAGMGRPLASPADAFPAIRAGYIWSAAHYETVAGRQVWVEGQWIADDEDERVALYRTDLSRR